MRKPSLARRLLAAAATLVALFALTATPASAATFGMGDNNTDLFSDGRWQSLPLKDVRRTVDWDTPSFPAKVAALDAWMHAARGAGARPLIAIDRSWTPGRTTKAPSVAAYATTVRWLKTRYPWWTTLTPWNEANHILQPTVRKPKLAYQYWRAAKQSCAGCTVTSPALLAAGGGVSAKFLPAFKKLAKGKVRLWAIHVYGDQNRLSDKGLKGLERQLKGKLWVTETAAWVKFGDSPKWRYDETRATRVVNFIFKSAKQHRRVARWYLWQWRGTHNARSARWDSGVLNFDGSERKHYAALVRGLRAAR